MLHGNPKAKNLDGLKGKDRPPFAGEDGHSHKLDFLEK
jgi:hypothetical protein